jgi:multisubunit Na+/H+ antiporter MnhG subunit
MSLVANERTKLLANNLDRASTACLTIGVLTPLAGFLYNINALQNSLSVLALAFGVFGWLLAAALLHLIARRVLGSLRP